MQTIKSKERAYRGTRSTLPSSHLLGCTTLQNATKHPHGHSFLLLRANLKQGLFLRCVMPDQFNLHEQAPTKSFSCFVDSPNEPPNAGPKIRVEQHNECSNEQKLSKVANYEALIAYTAAADFPMPTFRSHHRCGGC